MVANKDVEVRTDKVASLILVHVLCFVCKQAKYHMLLHADNSEATMYMYRNLELIQYDNDKI